MEINHKIVPNYNTIRIIKLHIFEKRKKKGGIEEISSFEALCVTARKDIRARSGFGSLSRPKKSILVPLCGGEKGVGCRKTSKGVPQTAAQGWHVRMGMKTKKTPAFYEKR